MLADTEQVTASCADCSSCSSEFRVTRAQSASY